jgi:phospholipase D1/2
LDGEAHDAPHDPETEAAERQSYVTEELYIHTKVLIVDDRKVICGSANLNDRSQCGDHDSEIAMIVEDQDLIDSKMNGEPYKVSRFDASLRRQLFREHLGLIGHQDVAEVTQNMRGPPIPQEYDFGSAEDLLVEDPLTDEFYNSLWWETAETNTTTFRDLFHPVPDDNVTTWEEYKAFFKPEPNQDEVVVAGHIYSDTIPVTEIREKLSKIRGHLVHFPTRFLEKVDLLGESILNDLTMNLYT